MLNLTLRPPDEVWPEDVKTDTVRQFGLALIGELSSLGDDSSAALGLDEQLSTERAVGPANAGSVWIASHTRNGRHIKGHYRARK